MSVLLSKVIPPLAAMAPDAVTVFPVNVVDPAEPIVPVVVIVSAPVSILPKPEVMEPELRAPTVVRLEVTTFDARVVPEMSAAALTVILALGNVMVLAAVGSVMAKVV